MTGEERSDEVKVCWRCGRRGTRGFHRGVGRHAENWSCDAAIACQDREYRRNWGGTR